MKDVMESEVNNLNQFSAKPVKASKIVKKVPHCLNEAELTLLRNTTENNAEDRAIVETLLSTGVRIGELLNIKLENINWKSRTVQIEIKRKNPRDVKQ